MAPSLVTVVLDLYDGQENPVTQGSATFTPSVALKDAPDRMTITLAPVTANLLPTAQRTTVNLIQTDAPGPLPAGWGWAAAFNVPGSLPGFSFFLPAGPASFTAVQASPAVFTWTAPGAQAWQLQTLPNGTGIQLSGGSLPGGFSAATTYYVVNASGFTFGLAAAQGGTPIASTSAGSGSLAVTQYNLSALSPVSSVTAMAAYMPLPSGTPSTGTLPAATGAGEGSSWQTAAALGLAPLASPAFTGTPTAPTATALTGNTQVATTAYADLAVGVEKARALAAEALLAPLASPSFTGTPVTTAPAAGDSSARIATTAFAAPKGSTVYVAQPTGLTATDTPAVTTAIASLVSALAFGPVTLMFADGTYQVDSNSAVIRSVSNFAVRSSGRTVIQQAPNRAGLPNNTIGDIFVIADCADLTVEGITFDGNRDVISPVTPVTAAITSGQPSVTVAAGQGIRFLAGTALNLYGGLGSAEQAQSQSLTVLSVTAGGGSGGGDLVTFTANITSTYNAVSGSLLNDAYGPYGCTGAYLTFYQPQVTNTVAGRAMTTEDQQNGLHLLNCQRFLVTGITSRNLWSSPVKLGAGIAAQANTYANSCSDGIVTGNRCYHGYDQGVSAWISHHVTVTGNWIDSPGWAGVSLTQSDFCTVTGNQVKNVVYFAAGQAGGGVVVEGGICNEITANAITSPVVTSAAAGISVQGWNTNAKWGLSSSNSAWPTLTAFTEQGTTAGTSVALSSTTGLMTGGRYSIFDGYRTEAVTVASVVDGTHVTFQETTRFSHAAGLYLSPRISQENTVTGNLIDLAGSASGASGVGQHGSVRSVIKGNTVRNFTNNGIDASAASIFCPPSSFIGGDGSLIEGNAISGGVNYPILASGTSRLTVAGNIIHGGTLQTGSTKGISVQGVTDSVFERNEVTDIAGSSAIALAAGGPLSAPCARVTVARNVAQRANGSGIQVTAGDSITVDGNICTSNTEFGIQFQGVANSRADGNTCNSNKTAGITLANNSSTGCTGVRVTGNTCRDDGTGVNVTTGATWTQGTGILEAGASDFNIFAGNELDANTSAQLTVIGAHSAARNNILSGSALPPSVATPLVPASGTAQANATGHDVASYIAGGAVTAVTVGATATGVTGGMVFVPAGQTITLTYTSAPTWTWLAAS